MELDEFGFNEDTEVDKKIRKDLKEIKDKLQSEKLSDEFKSNLRKRLIEELNK